MLTPSHDEGGGTQRFPNPKDLYVTKTLRLDQGDPSKKIEEIRTYFHKTFDIYENVFRCLKSDESYYVPPVHKLRHPMIFYFGHTATFYINKLVLAGLTTRINPKFEETFAIGVDEQAWDDLNEAHYSWPKVQEVVRYREMVRARIDEMLSSNRFQLRLPLTFQNSTENDDNAFFWAVMMGIEHERIHLETASVHVRELPLQYVTRFSKFWDPCQLSGEPPVENELVPFAGGRVRVGRDPDSAVYGWDTDYAEANRTITVAPFKASKYLVSNRHYLQFMKDGGYSNKLLWDEEGWNWVSWKKPTHPYFWVPEGTTYKLRVQVEEITMPWNWPVEVNHLEGKAYVNWLSARTGKKLRMPSEAEYLHMHDVCVGADQFEWEKAPGNVNLEQFRSSCPVDLNVQGKLCDVVGNVWQHLETPNYPYPGYRVHPLYDDFSMPCFDGRHMTMKGGAWISTGNEATRDSRFAFRRHFFQFIGIRYIEGEELNETKYLRSILGMDPEVDAAADFAFGKPLDNLPSFGYRLASVVSSVFENNKGDGVAPKRCLDLQCGGGRTTFELTKHFDEVIGVDFSARRLQTGFAIRERGFAQYSVVGELGEREAVTVEAKDFDWGPTRENAFFYQADAANLHAHLTGFDCIVAWNVVENTYSPVSIPGHLLSRLNPGGILVFAVHGHWDKSLVKSEDSFATYVEQNPLPAGTPATMGNVIRSLLGDSVEELSVTNAWLVAVFPETTRVGQFVNFEVLAFRKKE